MPTYECVTPHVRIRHGTHTNESWHTYEYVMPHVRMCHATRTDESRHTHESVMVNIRMSHAMLHVRTRHFHTNSYRTQGRVHHVLRHITHHTKRILCNARTHISYSYVYIPKSGKSAPHTAPYYIPHRTYSLQCSHTSIVFTRIHTEIMDECTTC